MLHATKYFSMFGMMANTINVQIVAFYSLISHLMMQVIPKCIKIELDKIVQIVQNNSINK